MIDMEMEWIIWKYGTKVEIIIQIYHFNLSKINSITPTIQKRKARMNRSHFLSDVNII